MTGPDYRREANPREFAEVRYDEDSRRDSSYRPNGLQSKWAGPDCSWSWVIAIACSFLNFFTLAMIRSGSIIFLKIMDYYNVSRTEASWPISLINATCNASGIFTGYCVRRFGPRKIVMIGSFISCTSIMACYFATDISKLTILCGIFHGFGMGLNLPAVALCLNVWFDKKKVVASSIICTGNALGSFVFPMTFDYVSQNLGFRSAHLIMGAMMAHSLIFACLLRMPPWLNSDGSCKLSLPRRSATVERFAPDHPLVKSEKYMKRSVSEHSFESHDIRTQDEEGFQRFHEAMHHHTVEPVKEESEFEDRVEFVAGNASTVSTKPVDSCRRSRGESMRSASLATAFTLGGPARLSVSSGQPNGAKPRHRRRSSVISSTMSLFGPHVAVDAASNFELRAHQTKKDGNNLLLILVGISFVLLMNFNSCYQTIMLDYAVDKGVDIHMGIYILSGFGLMDIAGRLSCGLISDSGKISRPTRMGLCSALFGITLNILPFASGFWSILACSSFVGFSIGTTMVLIPVLVGDYVGKPIDIPISLGLMAFITGTTGLGRPNLIGFFRDTLGYYDGLLRLMGALLFINGTVWTVVGLYESINGPVVKSAAGSIRR